MKENKNKKKEGSMKKTINISIGGNASLESVGIGEEAKVVNKIKKADNIVQTDNSNVTLTRTESTQQGMSLEEALKVFDLLYEKIGEMQGIQRKIKIEAKAGVEKAIAEIEEPEGDEPDKERIADHLKTSIEALKAAGQTALQSETFKELVGKATSWLGGNYQWLLTML